MAFYLKYGEVNLKEKKYNYFYRITNQINWKYYFGIRSTNQQPEKDSYFGGGLKLRAAIKKYGKENFIKVIIANYDTREEVSEHERLVVTEIQIKDENCYNIRTGGDNNYLHSDETIQKMKKAKEYISPETKLKMSTSAKNMSSYNRNQIRLSHVDRKPISDADRSKISAALKGRFVSESTRQKMSDSQKGKIVTPETRQKLSIANTGRSCPDHVRELVRELHTGKVVSEETREKLSIANSNKRNSNSIYKKCMIGEHLFECIIDVARHFNICSQTVRNRINSEKFPNWNYYSEELDPTI